MKITVNVDKFAVPYAIDDQSNVYHIKDGRPKSDEIKCPFCRDKVSFVSESDNRAAHFRHRAGANCGEAFRILRKTIHDEVCQEAYELLIGRNTAADLCKGQGSGTAMPTGSVVREKTVKYGGSEWRPDIIVFPAEGQKAPTLELEVVDSHKPEPARLEAAALAGHLIGVLDISRIEREYVKKRHMNEGFDNPEAIRLYIRTEKFSILGMREIRRRLHGALDRIYNTATVKPEHRSETYKLIYRPKRHQPEPSFKQPEYRPAATPMPAPRPMPPAAPIPQIMPHGSPNDIARAILADIDSKPDGDKAAITACLAQYRDAIALLEAQMPVRKIHIENLVKHKMLWREF